MHGRFTILQGGLDDAQPRLALGLDAMRASGWRVIIRNAGSIEESECQAWRDLCARMPNFDPFADPDFLLTAARHLARPAEVVFAFAEASTGSGEPRLRGVVPLVMPHPVWGGSQVRLWHPPVAPRPIGPTCEPGIGSAVIEAVVAHLAKLRSRTSLRLDRLPTESRLLRELSADRRLRVDTVPSPAPIPPGQFVEIAAREAPTKFERISEALGMHNAIERFLLTDARHSQTPILAQPGLAAAIRVTTRLFSRRDLAMVEFGYRGADVLSAAIHLGRPGARSVWRSVNRASLPSALPPAADVVVSLSREARNSVRTPRLRVIVS